MPRPPAHVPPPPQSGPPVALVAGVLAVAVAIAAVVVYLVMRPDPVDPGAGEDGAAITGVGSSPNALPNAGGIRVGDAGDAPQVHIYQDYQCPWCGLLEEVSGPAFTEAALSGDIQLTYTLMTFLDGNLDTDHSVRAANAALCADDQGAFVEFNAAVFAGQPDEEGQGWTDEQLVGFAEDSGVEDLETFTACLAEGTHTDYVRDMQTRSNQDGVSGSPRVFIDGTELDNDQMATLLEDPNSFPAILEEVAG
ncbi:DsbA family protein [Ornithinimicrobium murale]|uniref:DsbA family protein n=1 Tax=Ornithinimicrobium murale TaxID=1050153 RepID=UPI000E0DEA18|nr:thioredoxin domain-containing protein [Ornithinimicrobium murale]